jgi:23S rRNA maturation mini-RNase III
MVKMLKAEEKAAEKIGPNDQMSEWLKRPKTANSANISKNIKKKSYKTCDFSRKPENFTTPL